ncbi:MAG: DUF91 domain-containing protein [Chromatiales bacterium]|nr:DUF91 domain-containing protein [Chromatiales bacterium]
MSDIKLFTLNGENISAELASGIFAFERDLQKLIERNMKTILGINFLDTEYTTSGEDRGRIDSLDIDENYCPVIIEYKRSYSESIIIQGLFYLDWLMDHKDAFYRLTMDQLGRDCANKIEWSMPRLFCIANSFTRYDAHAVKQMNRNIELIRYKKYDDNILLIEQVVAGSSNTHISSPEIAQEPQMEAPAAYRTFNEIASELDGDLRDLYLAVVDFIENLGDDVQRKELRYYLAFKRLKNFICLEIRPQVQCIRLYLRVNPEDYVDNNGVNGIFRDVSGTGHWGTGDLELTIKNMEDFNQIQYVLTECYAAN